MNGRAKERSRQRRSTSLSDGRMKKLCIREWQETLSRLKVDESITCLRLTCAKTVECAFTNYRFKVKNIVRMIDVWMIGKTKRLGVSISRVPREYRRISQRSVKFTNSIRFVRFILRQHR